MRVRRVASLLLALMVLWAAPAHAELPEALQAPTDLSGEYDSDSHELRLSWLPPGNNTTAEYVYHVYRDADLLIKTSATNYTTNISVGFHAFHVTATDAEGQESLPSPPLFAYRAESSYGFGGLPGFAFSSGGGGSGCEAIIVNIGDTPPFVFPVIREECLPPLPCSGLDAVATRGSC